MLKSCWRGVGSIQSSPVPVPNRFFGGRIHRLNPVRGCKFFSPHLKHAVKACKVGWVVAFKHLGLTPPPISLFNASALLVRSIAPSFKGTR